MHATLLVLDTSWSGSVKWIAGKTRLRDTDWLRGGGGGCSCNLCFFYFAFFMYN